MRDRNENGAVSTEYALIITLVAIVVIGAVTLLGAGTDGLFSTVCSPPSPFSC